MPATTAKIVRTALLGLLLVSLTLPSPSNAFWGRTSRERAHRIVICDMILISAAAIGTVLFVSSIPPAQPRNPERDVPPIEIRDERGAEQVRPAPVNSGAIPLVPDKEGVVRFSLDKMAPARGRYRIESGPRWVHVDEPTRTMVGVLPSDFVPEVPITIRMTVQTEEGEIIPFSIVVRIHLG